MSRRMWFVVPLLVLLSACSSPSGTPLATTVPPSEPPPTPTAPVSSLIGNWTVGGADVEPGTVVTIDGYEARIWTSCGLTYGAYRADSSGLFAGSVSGWSGGCGTDQTEPSWIVDAHRWGDDGGSVVLMDERGAWLAVLEPGGTPTPGPNVLDTQASPPVLSAEDRARLDAEPSLPAGLRPATSEDLLGLWGAEGLLTPPPGGGRSGFPAATFDDDGTWGGTDGCNGGGGSWSSGPDGRFVATTGVSTLIGCDGAPVPGWVGGARLAGLDGDVLVLVGADGEELGRLVRVPPGRQATVAGEA